MLFGVELPHAFECQDVCQGIAIIDAGTIDVGIIDAELSMSII